MPDVSNSWHFYVIEIVLNDKPFCSNEIKFAKLEWLRRFKCTLYRTFDPRFK